jgi:hypothetical protein
VQSLRWGYKRDIQWSQVVLSSYVGSVPRFRNVNSWKPQSTILQKTSSQDELSEAKSKLMSDFGRGITHGILCGLAGVAPRSVIQNLITLLVWLLTRVPGDSRIWARDVLFGVRDRGVILP